MNSTTRTRTQDRRQFLLSGTSLTLGALFGSCPAVSLAVATDIIRIEEDWEIQVAAPWPDRNTPELVASMGPVADESESVVSLLINHATYPEYRAGGVQLQVWKNEQLMGRSTFAHNRQLATANEIIRFTLVMAMGSGKLKFQVTSGTSSTFGEFGGGNWIEAPTSLTSLASYSPAASIYRSALSVGRNRLSKYQINQVRVSTESGETIDKTVRSCL